MLRLLFFVGAVLEAVEQTEAVCSCAVMHWSLVASFPWDDMAGEVFGLALCPCV